MTVYRNIKNNKMTNAHKMTSISTEIKKKIENIETKANSKYSIL